MHSKFGELSESFSIRLKDMLSYKGIDAYFDADNLNVRVYLCGFVGISSIYNRLSLSLSLSFLGRPFHLRSSPKGSRHLVASCWSLMTRQWIRSGASTKSSVLVR
jgi:hypothetical protein